MTKHHQKPASFLERLIFNNRPAVVVLCLLISAFLFYQAAQVRPQTSFEKMIPLGHPYIQKMLEHQNDLANLGNTVRISVAAKDGDIFAKDYMETLRQIHDEVFYIQGVDRSNMKSLWSPSVRWTEVTEQGFAGGEVIPQTYDGSPESLDDLRSNILKSGQVGRLVANDFKSSIIDVPLMESYSDPEDRSKQIKLDYQKFSHELEEKIRDKYETQNPNVEIHIIGFAKKVGDLIDGLVGVALFFIVAIGITFALLLWFTRCLKSTIAVLITTLIAVTWQLGLLHTLGFGLDPYSMLVPFLVFAIGISHGVQIVNAMAVEAAKGFDSVTAARLAFRALYIPGMLALISDAFGFLTLFFIEIDVIRDLAVAAGIGVAFVILTNLVLHVLIMSYLGISKGGVRHVQNHGEKQDRKWRVMSYFAHPGVAPISLLIAVIGLGLGLYYKQGLKVGDLDQGAPELRADSRYNKDNAYIIDNYSTSADVLVVMVKTEEEQCTQYNVLRAMDNLQWELQNTPGVQSSASLADVSKIVTKALNEGNWKWYEISRNQTIINASIREAPAGLINTNCDLTPVLVFLEDHKAETLETVTERVEEFASNNNNDEYTFMLAAGNAGVEAATNDVISSAKNMMLIFVYGVVASLCLLTFRSIRAVLCILIPLGLTSILAEAIMAVSGIGIKVATLPVIALGVGIGVDYGIYIYSKLEKFLLEGKTLQEAYFETLRSTGKAVIFTGVTLGIGVVTWIFSPIKFQADMGLLLFFMFIWNMVGSIWLLPALARFLLRPDRMVAKARANK
jgi:hypothetical protein